MKRKKWRIEATMLSPTWYLLLLVRLRELIQRDSIIEVKSKDTHKAEALQKRENISIFTRKPSARPHKKQCYLLFKSLPPPSSKYREHQHWGNTKQRNIPPPSPQVPNPRSPLPLERKHTPKSIKKQRKRKCRENNNKQNQKPPHHPKKSCLSTRPKREKKRAHTYLGKTSASKSTVLMPSLASAAAV